MPNKNMKNIQYACVAAVLVLVLYITLHEFGHAMVMLYVGASVTEFSILTAHVSALGGNWNDLTALWLHANGVLLPAIAAGVYAALYQKNGRKFNYIFSFIFTSASVMSLLPWVIIPVTFVRGNTPVNDDITKFLDIFSQSLSPYIVSAAALLLMAGLVTLIAKKGILKNYISLVKKQ